MMGWIFEPHGGYGGNDPDGTPWPFGYISDFDGALPTPIFELSAVLENSAPVLADAAQKMAAAQDLYDALYKALVELQKTRADRRDPSHQKALDMGDAAIKKAAGQ